MKPQIIISLIVLIAAIIVGVSGIRFYPFSNYPMFSYKVKDLSTYALVIQQKNGPNRVIANRTIFPLTRLNLMQAVWMTQKGFLPNYDWARHLMINVKKSYPSAEQLSLQKIEFSDPYHPALNYRVSETLWKTEL